MFDDKKFEKYIDDIKSLIKENKTYGTKLGSTILSINFRECEVDANFKYFKKQYDLGKTPYESLINIDLDEDDLYRCIELLTNKQILEQVSRRDLESDIISDAWTSDLEEELETRYDTNLVNINNLDKDELICLIKQKYGADFSDPKEIICEALGFYNSFGYTTEEVIDGIKKIFR
jgi:hypothetical protein